MSKAENPDARVFAVDSRFHQMARREGGVARDQAIEQARLEIEEAKSHFDDWLAIELKEFTNLISKLGAAQADANWIKLANHHSRQLRDSATILGFELLSYVAGSLCEILDAIEAGGACNMASITCHVESLLLAGQPSYRHMKPAQVPDLTDGLQRVVRRVTATAK
jgi:hypothetical protein